MQRTTDFWVGDRVVRPSVGEIRLGIERVHLEPRSMQVLLALAAKAPEVVLKQELIDEVWGEKFVSDEVLTHAIWDLRRAFGDQASNPEFIQTIPKRGYRLIAPVKDFEPSGAKESARVRPFPLRPVLLGVLGFVVLGAAAVWIGNSGSGAQPTELEAPPPVERASLSGRRPEQTVLKLTLVPASPAGGPAIAPEALAQLRSALSGVPLGVEVQKREACSAPPGEANEYCLTPRLHKQQEGYQASVQIEETASSRLVYTASVDFTELSELQRAGAELAELANTFLEVVGTWDVRDPDIRPWISFRDHDVRAIRDFLMGRELVLSHEVGARKPFQSATTIDPGFVAPRVWRTPTLVSEADAEALATHQQDLLRLYDDAGQFDKTMISWAEAYIEGKPSEQLRQLELALDQQPENRPVRMLLGATTYGMGDPEEAWLVLEPLLQETWCYPPLYPLAAICALDLKRVPDVRRALELALQCDPVDPGSLALLRLLAVYDGDAAAESLYAGRLAQRTVEMLPEVVDPDVSRPAALLAAHAEDEGRREIAARLREFQN